MWEWKIPPGIYPAIRDRDGKAPRHKGSGCKGTPLKGVGIQESCTRCKGLIKNFVDADVLYHSRRVTPPGKEDMLWPV